MVLLKYSLSGTLPLQGMGNGRPKQPIDRQLTVFYQRPSSSLRELAQLPQADQAQALPT